MSTTNSPPSERSERLGGKYRRGRTKSGTAVGGTVDQQRCLFERSERLGEMEQSEIALPVRCFCRRCCFRVPPTAEQSSAVLSP